VHFYNGNAWVSFNDFWKLNGNNNIGNNQYTGCSNNHDFIIRTNNTNRIAIKSVGNVGVNNNNPTAKFQVNGSNANDLYVAINGNSSDPKIVTSYSLRFSSYAANGFYLQGRLNDNSGWVTLDTRTNVNWPGSYFLEFTFNNTTAYEDYRITFNGWDNPFLFGVLLEMEFKENIQQYPLFTVKTNGRIGISFDPPNQKLQVGGNILADAYTPDYVFEHYFEGQSELNPNYKSYSLEKTKKYIEKHKHLPGVPSAQEVKKQGGIILNEAIDTNLEKIEELYLHLFELNTRIKELEHLISIEEIKKAPQK